MKDNRLVWLSYLGPVIEGGISDRPLKEDPGGLTNRGITMPTLKAWRRSSTVTPQDLMNISQDEADAIASAMYWNAAKCDSLPGGVDICVADFSFHSSVERAVKVLQKLIGLTGNEVDGHIGPVTMKAIASKEPKKLIKDYCSARLAFMSRLGNWEYNKKGWQNRMATIERMALGVAPKRSPKSAAMIDNTVTVATAVTGVGAVITVLPAAREAYDTTADALSPFASIHPAIPIVAGIVASAVIVYITVKGLKRAN